MDAPQEPELNRQARESGFTGWISYGPVGMIDAAAKHAELLGRESSSIEVRDTAEPKEIFTFHMRRDCKYVCTNPRQGAE